MDFPSLVETLRHANHPLCDEAADEIELLEERIVILKSTLASAISENQISQGD